MPETEPSKKPKVLDHWSAEDITGDCPSCDKTTHVCHPGFGGCNTGFTMESTS